MNLTKGGHQNIPPGEGACMDTSESRAFAFKCTRRMSVFKFAVGMVEMISSTHNYFRIMLSWRHSPYMVM